MAHSLIFLSARGSDTPDATSRLRCLQAEAVQQPQEQNRRPALCSGPPHAVSMGSMCLIFQRKRGLAIGSL